LVIVLALVFPAKLGFELNRGSISERRVKALGVVDGFDEGADLAAGFVEVHVGLAVDLLGFERIRFAALRVMKLSALALS